MIFNPTPLTAPLFVPSSAFLCEPHWGPSVAERASPGLSPFQTKHTSISVSRLPLTSAIWRGANLHSGVRKQPGSSPGATQPLWSLTGLCISGRWWWTTWRVSALPRVQTEVLKEGYKTSQTPHGGCVSLICLSYTYGGALFHLGSLRYWLGAAEKAHAWSGA